MRVQPTKAPLFGQVEGVDVAGVRLHAMGGADADPAIVLRDDRYRFDCSPDEAEALAKAMLRLVAVARAGQ